MLREFAIVVLLVMAGVGVSATEVEDTVTRYHGPIVISSEADLKKPPEVSGVVAGDGSEANPYVISGWEILATGDAVAIANTRSHIILRDLVLTGTATVKSHPVCRTVAVSTPAGLVGARGNCRDIPQVFAYHSDNGWVRTPTVESTVGTDLVAGIRLVNTENVTIENNWIGRIASLAGTGIVVTASQSFAIQNNSVDDPTYGIRVENSTGGEVEGNEVYNHDYGISIFNSTDVRVDRNHVYRNSVFDIQVLNSLGINIQENLVETLGRGSLVIVQSPEVTLSENQITQAIDGEGHGDAGNVGIALYDSPGSTIIWNELVYAPGAWTPPFDKGLGICLSRSGSSLLEGNLAERIALYGSPHNTLRHNQISKLDVWINTGLERRDWCESRAYDWSPEVPKAVRVVDFEQDIDRSNRVNGRPIDYHMNVYDQRLEGTHEKIGLVSCIHCRNVTFTNYTASGPRFGFLLVNSTDVTVQGSSAPLSPAPTHPYDNVISESPTYGLVAYESSAVRVENSRLSGDYGIVLSATRDTEVANVSIQNSPGILHVSGHERDHFSHRMERSTADGLPILYLGGLENRTIRDTEAGFLGVYEGRNLSFSGVTEIRKSLIATSEGVKVENSVFSGQQSLQISSSRQVAIQNSILGGLRIVDTEGIRVENNRFTAFTDLCFPAQIESRESRDIRVIGNRFPSEGSAWYPSSTSDSMFSRNIVAGGGCGSVVQQRGSSNFQVTDNNLFGRAMIAQVGGEPVNAPNNWWNHPTGPSPAYASTFGAVITEPHRTEPTVEAGLQARTLPNHLVINEYAPCCNVNRQDPPPARAELFNPLPTPVVLAGWTLDGQPLDGYGILQPGAFLTVEPGGNVLRDPQGDVVDIAPERDCCSYLGATHPSATWWGNASWARWPDGEDSNHSTDWVIQPPSFSKSNVNPYEEPEA